MKTGKKIVIAGAVGIIGYLAYLYFKSKKPDTASNDSSGGFISSLPPFIQSVLPSSESNSNTSSTTSGTSTVAPDPLSTSEQKIADVVIAEIKKDENTLIEAQIKEANDYIAKRALVEQLNALKVVEGLRFVKNKPSTYKETLLKAGITNDGLAVIHSKRKEVENLLNNTYGLYPDQFGSYKI
jgi:hypothetical protein